MIYRKPEDTIITLSDGTPLAGMSKDALFELHGSCAKLMAVIGRTPHYRRKNRSNIELMELDRRRIDEELARRATLNKITIAGWPGHIEKIHEPAVLQHWYGEPTGDLADDPCILRRLKINGHWYKCPKDRTPTLSQLVDSIYELRMDMPLNMVMSSQSFWIRSSARDDIPQQCIFVRGHYIKTLILMGMAKTEHVPDPLNEVPWTVADLPEDSLDP